MSLGTMQLKKAEALEKLLAREEQMALEQIEQLQLQVRVSVRIRVGVGVRVRVSRSSSCSCRSPLVG
jgi:hypothetical protein|tara:strand:- start:327 stop:527 length:201 start_codon:yes stop_codon:yes gene_type:complete